LIHVDLVFEGGERMFMAPTLPQIRVQDFDWDFENVKALGDSIPGYRSSASESVFTECCSKIGICLYVISSLSFDVAAQCHTICVD